MRKRTVLNDSLTVEVSSDGRNFVGSDEISSDGRNFVGSDDSSTVEMAKLDLSSEGRAGEDSTSSSRPVLTIYIQMIGTFKRFI